MFDISLAELALIVVVAVVFIGPKELPAVIQAIAKAMRWMKDIGKEIRAAFDELARESGVEDLKKEVHYIRGDDGKLYESYHLPTPPLDKKHDAGTS